MTTEEFYKLDAWIAEYVMGMHRMTFNNHGSPPFNYLTKEKERADKYRKHGFVDGLPLIGHFQNYSTDAAAAMEVLKKCNDTIFGVRIYRTVGNWNVCDSDEEIGCDAPTIELAICLFAKNLFSK